MNNEYNNLIEKNLIFGGFFNMLRFKRVLKLEQHFGKTWFKNKNILELGCAFGNIGFHFKYLGANVTFSDANTECLEIVKLKDNKADVIFLNQDTKWKLNKKFDLIIHFGLLYNLNHWKQDLIICLKYTKHLALETSVTKFFDNTEFKIVNYNYTHILHGPFNGVGSLVSAKSIESTLMNNNCIFKRYDDPELNFDNFVYDWKEQLIEYKGNEKLINSHWDNPFYGGRRYWIIKNKIN